MLIKMGLARHYLSIMHSLICMSNAGVQKEEEKFLERRQRKMQYLGQL